MTRTIDAVFDGIVFRPIQPLTLRPNKEYAITILDVEDDGIEQSPHVQSQEHSAGDELVSSAWNIYNDRLKAVLEPAYIGQVVAIHPDSGDYEVARNSPTARRQLRKRCASGLFVVIHIGTVPDDNPLSLRARNAMRRLQA